ncbi:CBS domain-containing protein [Nitrosopumilus sp.]|uniref:CBS domain-containing protein n=1 Tax=Nitrosopumilus sp. TaxID=2024843 RepID=UPI00263671E3|nr:CBS domain-containing protein [Nitrosopumilus sp.]
MKLEKFEKNKVGKMLEYIIEKGSDKFTAPYNIKIKDAGKHMDNDYGILALTDPSKKVVQVISESDIRDLLSKGISLDPTEEFEKTLKSVAARVKYTPITTDSTIKEAIDFVVENKVQNLVVVDENSNFYGVINKDNLVKAIDEIVD